MHTNSTSYSRDPLSTKLYSYQSSISVVSPSLYLALYAEAHSSAPTPPHHQPTFQLIISNSSPRDLKHACPRNRGTQSRPYLSPRNRHHGKSRHCYSPPFGRIRFRHSQCRLSVHARPLRPYPQPPHSVQRPSLLPPLVPTLQPDSIPATSADPDNRRGSTKAQQPPNTPALSLPLIQHRKIWTLSLPLICPAKKTAISAAPPTPTTIAFNPGSFR